MYYKQNIVPVIDLVSSSLMYKRDEGNGKLDESVEHIPVYIIDFLDNLLVTLCNEHEVSFTEFKEKILIPEGGQRHRMLLRLRPVMKVFFVIAILHKKLTKRDAGWFLHRDHSCVIHYVPRDSTLKNIEFSEDEKLLYDKATQCTDLIPFEKYKRKRIDAIISVSARRELARQIADWVIGIEYTSKRKTILELMPTIPYQILFASLLYMFKEIEVDNHVFTQEEIAEMIFGKDNKRKYLHSNIASMIANHKTIMSERSKDVNDIWHRKNFYAGVIEFQRVLHEFQLEADIDIVTINVADIRNKNISQRDQKVITKLRLLRKR